MEPISTIVISIALGAGATAGQEGVKVLVQDAYRTLKDLISKRYPKVSLQQLEQTPQSSNSRAVVEKELISFGADRDVELLAAAHRLTDVIRQHAPSAAAAIGVDLKDVAAANVRLADIVASGSGVKVESSTFTGDIEIRDVRAGVSPGKLSKGD